MTRHGSVVTLRHVGLFSIKDPGPDGAVSSVADVPPEQAPT